MEPIQEGKIEFRITEQPVYDKHGHQRGAVQELQYRQCFGGMWQPWVALVLPSKSAGPRG